MEKRIYIPLPNFESRKELIRINLRSVEVDLLLCLNATYFGRLEVLKVVGFYFVIFEFELSTGRVHGSNQRLTY